MTSPEQLRIRALGDAALLVTLPPDPPGASAALAAALQRAIDAGTFDGIEDLVPAEDTLLIAHAPGLEHAPLRRWLRQQAVSAGALQPDGATEHTLPVCYDADFGPDLDRVAREAGLTLDDVIELHAGATYTVRAVGFAPGFAYLGEVDARIATPRHATPRQQVPAGAVGIADARTAVYPAASPGGWNLIGRCPAALFDPRRSLPSLLRVGDTVRLQRIDRDEFQALEVAR